MQTYPARLDEIWSVTYAKQKNVAGAKSPQPWSGDTWTWVAIDPDTKLVPSWLVGGRSGYYAKMFVSDLAGRLANRIQLTSDGHKAYLEAVEDAFGADVDYAMLVKLYGHPAKARQNASTTPPCAAEVSKASCAASQTKCTFRPAMLNDRTSRCG